MNFKGTYNFDQQISIVWKTLNNPDAIKACIDGCSQFIEVESNVYKAKIKINLGPVNANFSSEIKIKDIIELKSYVIEANGNANQLGFGKGTVKVTLKEKGESTILEYSANTQISGKIAQLGARLIEGSVKKNTNSFFKNLEIFLQGNLEKEKKLQPKRLPILKKVIDIRKYIFIFVLLLLTLSFIIIVF